MPILIKTLVQPPEIGIVPEIGFMQSVGEEYLTRFSACVGHTHTTCPSNQMRAFPGSPKDSYTHGASLPVTSCKRGLNGTHPHGAPL